jgi:proteic killer suppression protein
MATVTYATKWLRKVCLEERFRKKELSADVGRALQNRLTILAAIQEMNDLLTAPGRWEQLTGDRAGDWSARLSANWRIVVAEAGADDQPLDNEAPEEDDTTIIVKVLEIVDYHHK